MWRVISHLCLNHLSLSSDDGSPDALRELLAIYDHEGSAENRSVIAGVVGVLAAAGAATLAAISVKRARNRPTWGVSATRQDAPGGLEVSASSVEPLQSPAAVPVTAVPVTSHPGATVVQATAVIVAQAVALGQAPPTVVQHAPASFV